MYHWTIYKEAEIYGTVGFSEYAPAVRRFSHQAYSYWLKNYHTLTLLDVIMIGKKIYSC